jgi:predicted nucleotidyltransferase
MDGLTAHQIEVMDRVLREEEGRREHVVVYLSGAHAYGFPSPDSDLDLKAIHVEKTESLLGLTSPIATFDRAEILDGVEIDYTSNELAGVLAGILGGNGNYIERVLGRLAVRSSPSHEALKPLVRGALSRRVHRHYRGFASSQLAAFDEQPTAKKLLYVLRTTATGIHLLRTGELETDLATLFPEARELIERKRAGERVMLEPAVAAEWRGRVGERFADLDRAWRESVLPEAPQNAGALEAWLVAARTSRLRSDSRRNE